MQLWGESRRQAKGDGERWQKEVNKLGEKKGEHTSKRNKENLNTAGQNKNKYKTTKKNN